MKKNVALKPYFEENWAINISDDKNCVAFVNEKNEQKVFLTKFDGQNLY